MIERETEIVNRLGLHARAAAKLVHTAGGFQSRVTVVKDGEEVDAKSILGILLLAAAAGEPGASSAARGRTRKRPCAPSPTLIANRFDEEC